MSFPQCLLTYHNILLKMAVSLLDMIYEAAVSELLEGCSAVHRLPSLINVDAKVINTMLACSLSN